MMPTFTERAAVADDDRTDRRVRRCIRERARREFDCAREIRRVGSVYGETSTPFQKAM
jgi:hypothetical protein